jgi:hypothetical protein
MPGREFAGYGPIDRTRGIDVRFVPYTVLRDVGRAGARLCVDIAHLYTELMVNGNGRFASASQNGLYARVRAASAELAPYTRHIHLSTVTPPWNGTDGHSGFLETDYALGAIPTYDQLLSLLGLFAPRGKEPLAGQNPAPLAEDPSWIIPEPNGGAQAHLANYGRLREWLRGIT